MCGENKPCFIYLPVLFKKFMYYCCLCKWVQISERTKRKRERRKRKRKMTM
jgi:hypothetical protein